MIALIDEVKAVEERSSGRFSCAFAKKRLSIHALRPATFGGRGGFGILRREDNASKPSKGLNSMRGASGIGACITDVGQGGNPCSFPTG